MSEQLTKEDSFDAAMRQETEIGEDIQTGAVHYAHFDDRSIELARRMFDHGAEWANASRPAVPVYRDNEFSGFALVRPDIHDAIEIVRRAGYTVWKDDAQITTPLRSHP